ncbi:MAG: heparinase II/III family protein [Rhodospirillales bacterium]|nr:heparinase II/III family protein [Rhodospirillales bacterium]
MNEKLRQLARDATLRRWLLARALGRAAPPPHFVPHRPRYLAAVMSPMETAAAAMSFAEIAPPAPEDPIVLPLAGTRVEATPGDLGAVFARAFADTESLLALHRFAWIPLLGAKADPAWVAALWRAWRARFAVPDDSWAWHPYTAAERAVNLLRFSRRHGFPAPADDTAAVLAAHAPAIAARLEYYGEHHTGNHLANNGRGLFALGLELGLPGYADLGARILIEEAKRIFRPSGALREGSSHYHLLLARNYADAWLWARRHGHASAAQLEEVLRRALAVVPRLSLPGGLPLVGDVSPDCPPGHLAPFLPGGDPARGWGALLDEDERAAFLVLKNSLAPCPAGTLAADGWLRADFVGWSGLWHLDPGGFAPMPGHGHHDAGSFEVHWRDLPLFVDLGRGSYGEDGEASHYRSALVHNSLTLDDADPYPPNKPYYDDTFRRREGGAPPSLARESDGVALSFGGYRRLGAPFVRRRWRFATTEFSIEDQIEGRGRRRIARRLHTSWPTSIVGGQVVVHTPVGDFRARAEGIPPALKPVVRWTAYGEGIPATAVAFECAAALPWNGILRVEKI